jgi:hypothetical protein
MFTVRELLSQALLQRSQARHRVYHRLFKRDELNAEIPLCLARI